MLRWLHKQRTSTRLGVVLQVGTRVLSSILSLVWTPLLLGVMGAPLYGSFLSFQAVAALGGLGDLGMGGAVALRAGRHLGAGEGRELAEFLAKARTLFLILAAGVLLIYCFLSPWLPTWFGFREVPGSGSLPVLFCVGGVFAVSIIAGSYVHNLNHAALSLNVLAIPFLVIGQTAFVLHWILARSKLPLWAQQSAHVLGAVLTLALSWLYLRRVQPAMARLTPLQWDPKAVRGLLAQSGWVYLAGLGSFVYTTVDRLLINAGFGPAQVPLYQLNNKLCELALFVIANLTFVAVPKMTLWLASPNPGDHDRVRREAVRLNAVQAVVGLATALGFLMINDRFMKAWLGPEMKAPLEWQIAFAASLAVTAGSDVGLQLGLRTGERGLSVGGRLLGITALLNFALSYSSMRAGSIVGIAGATVIAQSAMSIAASRYLCDQLSLSWRRWVIRSWALPVSLLSVGALVRWRLPLQSARQFVGFGALVVVLVGVAAWALGITPAAFKREVRIWTGMLGRR